MLVKNVSYRPIDGNHQLTMDILAVTNIFRFLTFK